MERTANRARKPEPVIRIDKGLSDAFACGVVLVDDRTPPVDHPPLDLRRTWRRCVDGGNLGRQVVSSANLLRKLQHANEHRRDILSMCDAILLDRDKDLLGVGLL